MQLRLDGKRALVCGSSQGIGRAVVRELWELGAELTLLARNRERLEAVLAELGSDTQRKHHFLVADFNDPSQVESALAGYLKDGVKVQVLVNNTGGPPPGAAHTAAPAAFVAAFAQHLLCNQVLVQALLPGMKASGYGRIINIISTSVKQPIPNLGVSNTVRGAVANWAKTLASELGPFGITVNNVLPGATRTGRLEGIFMELAAKTGKAVADIEAEHKATIPARRFAEPEEVAAAVAFLASPAAGYVNGINLPVDGGRTLSL